MTHPSDHEKLLSTLFTESARVYTALCQELLQVAQDPEITEDDYYDLACEVVEAEIRYLRTKADLLAFRLEKGRSFDGVEVPDHLPEDL
jgi:hypothetical protein